ncbi:hypothetical protein [Nocardioides sp. R-C-SC26]|uniref:hypothetical protein n=1 Tax=Nocardioides sp. R-C-SC26 TaxID=2870414 RepID=UPI001E2CACBF|nr:hypothetical protein [Nocardioides sp. R-C-SC26]
MRGIRLIAALITGFVLLTTPLVATPGASAENADATSARTASASATATAERRAERKVGIKVVKRKGKLFLVGNVTPPKGPVIIDRGTKCNPSKGTCNFKRWKKASIKKGRYEVRVYAPRTGSLAWRARVGNAKSDIWVTCKKRVQSSPCPTP